MSSEEDRKLALWTIFYSIGFWLISSRIFRIWGEPIMLLHGVLTVLICFTPVIIPAWLRKRKEEKTK